MEIYIGKHNGFCAGVKRAVDMAEKIGKEGVYILGELIHNVSVVKKIEALGVKSIDRVEEISDGTLIIRSHGVPKSIFDKLKDKNVEVVDCTCPFVKKIHNIVAEYSKNGYKIIIVGEKTHPEVEGIAGWSETEPIILSEFDDEIDYNQFDKICIVAQTTCSVEKFEQFLEKFKNKYNKTVEVFKTICYTTMERQKEAKELSSTCDAMVVIGGVKSSNTKKLADICLEHCENVFLINEDESVDANKLVNFLKVGIISGASTPIERSREVFSKMEEVTEVKAVNEMEAAVAKLENNPKFRVGQRVVATISSATDEGLALYINNTKKEILIDKKELNCESYDKDEYTAKIGDEINVMIIGLNPVILSEKAIVTAQEEEKVIEEIKNGKTFEVTVNGTNKGGLTAQYGSYGVFIPSSQIRVGFVKDLEKYVGKTLKVRAEKVESKERRKQIVASARVIIEEERAARDAAKAATEEAFFSSVNVDDIVVGKVVRFASFGAFVEVNGFDCLAHISDLSWTGCKSPADVLEIGKEYEFKVLKADKETKKVSIGYKQLMPRPWDYVPGKYNVGDVVDGKIVRIVDFGVFVELDPGVDGLVHISQISHEWKEKPTEGLKIGDVVSAKIIGIDYDREKITLSIKAATPAPEGVEKPKRERKENAEGEEKPKRRPRHDRAEEDDGLSHEWKDEGISGASIAELINKKSDEE
ncbi:MAG: bifunctional 4-hydroxy-3-methylbut-2-enyl diphosphate reductase/30S ribosomal protein S1 [Clostridia bacterium]|nr:bifunctional 4-hydroxy-3-methylbut-2-enyl diphosphate reductase/30S ribosomal protein S1 [Clostridia bacterium]